MIDVRSTETGDSDLESELEERADYIPLQQLSKETAVTDLYAVVHKKLIQAGTKLISGPRGCGKTHLMRFTYLQCKEKAALPLAVYASFNRYYRLEPLLQRQSSAVASFHIWVLAVILKGLLQSIDDFSPASGLSAGGLFPKQFVDTLIAKLERGQSLTADERDYSEVLTISFVQGEIERAAKELGRRRTVLLLDDAALTLSTEYLHEFFDIVRAIKTSSIAPKAAVYPGSTEYGPNFHVQQEAEIINVWLSPEDATYTSTMALIGELRTAGYGNLPPDVVRYLMYVAFGVPRAFLVLLRGFQEATSGTTQAAVNRLTQEHTKNRLDEYLSLKLKMPKLGSIIEVGELLFQKLVAAVQLANDQSDSAQLIVGLAGADQSSSIGRMLSLLIEAGLLHETQAVSHGPHRSYRRFVVNVAFLLEKRAFSSSRRGTAYRDIVELLETSRAKHPLRRSITSLLTNEEIARLQLDLPPCAHCKAVRISPNQKFCHECGFQLVDPSAFDQCMGIEVTDVPGLTGWQRQRVKEIESFKTIGDFLAEQNPAAQLRKIYGIGERRATRIIQLVTGYVDEFLS